MKSKARVSVASPSVAVTASLLAVQLLACIFVVHSCITVPTVGHFIAFNMAAAQYSGSSVTCATIYAYTFLTTAQQFCR